MLEARISEQPYSALSVTFSGEYIPTLLAASCSKTFLDVGNSLAGDVSYEHLERFFRFPFIL